MVKQIARQTKTNTDLRVNVDGLKKTYQTGHKVAHDFKQTMRIAFDEELPKWNKTAGPIPSS